MGLVPIARNIDDARRAIQKLASNKLGPNASPTYYGLTLTTPLTVPNGGTGLITLTDHGILLGSGTGAITSLAAAINGQIPIGSTGADPVLAAITGTANRVTVSNAAGTITLSTPQDTHTSATPTFARETLTDTCLVAGGANFLRVTGLQTDGVAMTGTLRGAYIDVSNGSTAATGTIRGMELKARTEAPDDIGNDVTVLEGLSISADSKCHSVTTMRAAEFILDGSTGGTITEAVGLRIANNLQANKATTSYGLQIYRDSFDYTADIQLSDGSVINKSGKWGIGTANPVFGRVEVYGNGVDTFIAVHEDAGTHKAGIHLRVAANDFEIYTNNSGTLYFDWEGTTVSKLQPGDRWLVNKIRDLSGGNLSLQDDGGNVGIGTTSPNAKLHVNGNILVSNGQEIRFNDIGDSHHVGFKAPALTANQIWTLPTVDGNADEILTTNGSGVLSFVRKAKAIYAELSDSTDQAFAVAGTHYSITFNTNDELVGITHSTSVNPENITIDTTGVYTIFAQPQVTAAAGGAGTFHMWLQRDTGGGFADIANTNIELSLASNDEDVIPLATTFALDSGDIIRLRVVVSDDRISLDTQAAVVGPPTEPAIPSIIFTMFMIGT